MKTKAQEMLDFLDEKEFPKFGDDVKKALKSLVGETEDDLGVLVNLEARMDDEDFDSTKEKDIRKYLLKYKIDKNIIDKYIKAWKKI